MVAHLLAYTGLSALMQMLTALLLHVHDTQLLLKQRAPTAKTVLTGYWRCVHLRETTMFDARFNRGTPFVHRDKGLRSPLNAYYLVVFEITIKWKV